MAIRITAVLALSACASIANASGYYEYTAAPDTPSIYLGQAIHFTVDSHQQFDSTFLVMRDETVGGPGWSSDRHDLRQTATLTTNAAGYVITWNVVGSDINRYVEFYWSSSFANGVFQESYRSEEGFITGCILECNTSAESQNPGTWRYVATESPTPPVPEPAAYWMALAGIVLLAATRGMRRA